jgi:hypothetical protein
MKPFSRNTEEIRPGRFVPGLKPVGDRCCYYHDALVEVANI